MVQIVSAEKETGEAHAPATLRKTIMPKFIVKTPINHNGKPYAPGKIIDLADDDAASLLAADAIEPSNKPARKEEKEKKSDDKAPQE